MLDSAQQNFKEWFIDVLKILSATPGSGFSILMVSMPLLERYLREMSGRHEEKLRDPFYSEMLRVFPELLNEKAAEDFWQVYRNGLLHQVALSLQNSRGEIMPLSGLRDGNGPIEFTPEGYFWVNPASFSERVVDVIQGDFSTFLGEHSPYHPLPTIGSVDQFGLGTASPEMWKKDAFKSLKRKS
jgi:hypothetical protein